MAAKSISIVSRTIRVTFNKTLFVDVNIMRKVIWARVRLQKIVVFIKTRNDIFFLSNHKLLSPNPLLQLHRRYSKLRLICKQCYHVYYNCSILMLFHWRWLCFYPNVFQTLMFQWLYMKTAFIVFDFMLAIAILAALKLLTTLYWHGSTSTFNRVFFTFFFSCKDNRAYLGWKFLA